MKVYGNDVIKIAYTFVKQKHLAEDVITLKVFAHMSCGVDMVVINTRGELIRYRHKNIILEL